MMEIKATSWGCYEHKTMASSFTIAKAEVPRKQFHVQVPEALRPLSYSETVWLSLSLWLEYVDTIMINRAPNE